MNPIAAIGNGKQFSTTTAYLALKDHSIGLQICSHLTSPHRLTQGSNLPIAPNTGHRQQHRYHLSAMRQVAVILAATALGSYAPRSSATAPCDTWLGDFSTSAGDIAAIRVEKSEHAYRLRFRQQEDQWSTETESVSPSSMDEMAECGLSPLDCVLSARGIRLIAAPEGTPYAATSIGGNNFGEYLMNTSHLLVLTQGFQVDGLDMYRVPSANPSTSP